MKETRIPGRNPAGNPGPFAKILVATLCGLTLLAGCLATPPAQAQVSSYQTMRVGLYHGSTRLTSANLANETGSGFTFGYYGNSGTTFTSLGQTNETGITMVRSSNVYRSGNDFTTSGSSNPLGCYHVVHSTGYSSYSVAKQEADKLIGGFVAWIDGVFQVRMGHYTSMTDAKTAAGARDVGETSSYGINVVKLGTNEILFQFDGGSTKALGIVPDITGHSDPTTWFKNIKYRGAFRYQRVDQTDLTVVNVVDLEPYVKGVIPYEMSASWPVEALKTQAVCARTYGVRQAMAVNHRSENFDLCNNAHCQVYNGLGGPATANPSTVSDQAVNETAGMYLWYNGGLAGTFYSSSHGGASEAVSNVWLSTSQSAYPYLSGVVDPYEHMADNINSKSSWTVSYSKAELTTMLQGKGYGSGQTISKLETKYSPTGNVMALTVHWSNGGTNTFYPDNLRYTSWFNLPSIHFAINETLPTNKVYPDGSSGGTSGGSSSGSSGSGYTVNEEEKLDSLAGTSVLSSAGVASTADSPYVITGTGDVSALTSSGGSSSSGSGSSGQTGNYQVFTGSHFASGDVFHFNGAGWGHNIGMSQFGAYAMAKEFGFDYKYILEFYFPGTTVARA